MNAHSNFYLIFRRLIKNRLAAFGAFSILLVVMAAILAPFIAPYDPLEHNYGALLCPPSMEHLAGTDSLGRDLFSRVVYGSRYALLIGVVITLAEFLIGTLLGTIAGYAGGIVDSTIMRLVDIMFSLPIVVLGLALAGSLGGGLPNVIIAVSAVGWRGFARLVRGQVLSVKENMYVEAAHALGQSGFGTIIKHILPNVVSPIIVYGSLQIPGAILIAASLSFLGVGAQPPTPCWGLMLAEGRDYLVRAWWMTTAPGLAIVTTVLGFNFLGDGLRDAIDPKLRRVFKS